MKRIDRNYDYYSTNPMIKGTFDFLKMVVDNWFKTVDVYKRQAFWNIMQAKLKLLKFWDMRVLAKIFLSL